MPALVYRITEVLSAIVIDLPLGTNLGLFHIQWTLLSGRLLQTRGALIPALAATGLEPATVRQAWAAFAHGAWDISQLVAGLRTVVRHAARGRWHAQHIGGYRVVAVDTTGFFRPRLKNCATKHFLSQAGEALPAIPFGLTPCPTRRVRVASVGTVGFQVVPLVRQVVRAPSPTATEAEVVNAVLRHVATQLAPDEAAVVDPHSPCSWGKCRGFTLGKLHAAGLPRWVSWVPRNFTARRVAPPAYAGKGRRPSRGVLVRPLARTRKGHTLLVAGRSVQADIWSGLCLPQAQASPAAFQCVVVRDPAYREPWVLATNLALPAADLLAFYRARWPVEQVPLAAKQLIGAARQFIFAEAACQRLPELALLAASWLMYLAATHPAQPTGFWDRTPRPTAGRLRRVLAQLDISKTAPLPRQLRKKASVTDHLPKGIQAHRRSAQTFQARV